MLRGVLAGAGVGFLLGKTGLHHALLSTVFVAPADATPVLLVALGCIAGYMLLLEGLARLAAGEQPCDPSVRTTFRGNLRRRGSIGLGHAELLLPSALGQGSSSGGSGGGGGGGGSSSSGEE